MTVKLTKTIITGFDDLETTPIGVNPNIRITQQYSSDTVIVKIEKVIRPDLTREDDIELSYETLLEQTFTAADFPMVTDHNSFYVEYNVLTNSFEILDVLAFGKSNKSTVTNYHGTELHRDIKKRYTENLLPIFYVKTFDAAATGFNCSLINFYVNNHEGDAADTIILNSDVEEMTTQERHLWINENLVSYLTFVIKNEDGSQIIDAEQTRLFAVNALGQPTRSNKYKVSLPAAKYNIEVNVEKGLYPENANTYNIRVVNGFINKTRVSSGAGTFGVKLDISELDAGDFSKLKFDLGQFESYAELWVEVI
jgi:hypothetical protein